MSNVLEVSIVAEGPWPLPYGLDGPTDEQTAAANRVAQFVGRITLNPVYGLGVTVDEAVAKISPNVHGGITNIDRLMISGREAISWRGLESLVQDMQLAGLTVVYARAADVEPGNPHEAVAILDSVPASNPLHGMVAYKQ